MRGMPAIVAVHGPAIAGSSVLRWSWPLVSRRARGRPGPLGRPGRRRVGCRRARHPAGASALEAAFTGALASSPWRPAHGTCPRCAPRWPGGRRPAGLPPTRPPGGRGRRSRWTTSPRWPALRTGPETELYFALVPYYPARQAAGTTARQVARIDTHLASSPAGSREWGICTECGMGRVQAGDVPALLDLHRTVLDSHGANR